MRVGSIQQHRHTSQFAHMVWSVPLDLRAVMGCFSASETAIGDMEVDGRIIGHACHVLNKMGRDGKHAGVQATLVRQRSPQSS